MSELISGKEALIALANGDDVELRNLKDTWYTEWTDYSSFKFKTWIGFFIEGESQGYEFRLKPKTITINGNSMVKEDAFAFLCGYFDVDYDEVKKLYMNQ